MARACPKNDTPGRRKNHHLALDCCRHEPAGAVLSYQGGVPDGSALCVQLLHLRPPFSCCWAPAPPKPPILACWHRPLASCWATHIAAVSRAIASSTPV